MREQQLVEPRSREASGLTLAARAAGELLHNLLDLALRTAGADRVALLLLEDDGTLACHAMSGEGTEGELAAVRADSTVCLALQTGEPVTVAVRHQRPAPEWCEALGARSLVLVGLHTPLGPAGLLALGWDERRPRRSACPSAAMAATAVAGVLNAAIAGEVDRRHAAERRAVIAAEREPLSRPLAGIYVRSGLLRLQMADGGPAAVAEVERLSRMGLEALDGRGRGSGDLLADLAS